MKKLYTLLALVITLITNAQAPQGFNYQATVRNSSGALIVNQNVNFKFNIMLNSATSLPVFSETHLAPTDDLGQVNLVIGQGTATTGTFSTINWGTGNYYLGIELNTGSGYVAMGTTQLLSVPFALYANTAGNSQATNNSNPFLPQGIPNNAETKIITNQTYTVPSGKNLYLINMGLDWLSNEYLNVNSIIYNIYYTSSFILPENTTININGPQPTTPIIGFTVDNSLDITPVIHNFGNGPFTVPTNKKLYLFSSNVNVAIDGNNFGLIDSTESSCPFLLTEGITISCLDIGSEQTGYINGYLK